MTDRIAVAALLLLLVGTGAAFAEPPSAADAALQKADELWKAGRTDDALETVSTALDETADDDAVVARLETRLGRYRVARGEPYAALPHFEVAVERRGTVEDRLRLAEALLAVARQALAGGQASSLQVTPYLMDARSTAEAIDAENAEAARRNLVLAEVFYWEDKLEDAGRTLDGIETDGLPARTARSLYELRAQVCYRQADYEKAAKAFRAAENPRGEASAWSAAKRPKELVDALELVLDGRPYDPALVDWTIQCALFADAARGLLPSIEALSPGAAHRAHHLLARARLQEAVGDLEEAAARLQEAADASPEAVEPLLQLGRLAYADGGGDAVDRAVGHWIEALTRQPANERVLGLLWDQAGRDYGRAWRSPVALARSLRIQEAIAVALGDDGLAWANYGNTLRIAGRLDAALGAYDKAQAAEPDDPGIASDRGLVLSALGRKPEALEAFEAAVRIDPEHDAAHQNAARARALAGDPEGAWTHLDRALEATRKVGEGSMRYRFLASRLWRSTQNGRVR